MGLIGFWGGPSPALGAEGPARDAAALKRWEARRSGVRSAAATALDGIHPAPKRRGGIAKQSSPAAEPSLGPGLSQVEVEGYFSFLAGQTQIPFRYPEDGCYARAHEMAHLLEEKGVESEKVFLFGNLRVETRFAPGGFVSWWYHVAPVVAVRDAVGRTERRVMDPSVSSGPLAVSEWITLQTGENCAKVPLGATYAEGCFYQFTARFTYLPGSIDLRPTQWLPEDLADTRHVLEELSRLAADRH